MLSGVKSGIVILDKLFNQLSSVQSLSGVWLFVAPWTSLPGSSIHGDSPGPNTEVGCLALLQGIFPTQGLNPGLLHCRWILYQMSHQGSPV